MESAEEMDIARTSRHHLSILRPGVDPSRPFDVLLRAAHDGALILVNMPDLLSVPAKEFAILLLQEANLIYFAMFSIVSGQ